MHGMFSSLNGTGCWNRCHKPLIENLWPNYSKRLYFCWGLTLRALVVSWCKDGWGGRWVGCSSLADHPSATQCLSPQVFLSMMPFSQDMKIQLNSFSANNVKTHYNWLLEGNGGTETANLVVHCIGTWMWWCYSHVYKWMTKQMKL
jgi:hypothetical protein